MNDLEKFQLMTLIAKYFTIYPAETEDCQQVADPAIH